MLNTIDLVQESEGWLHPLTMKNIWKLEQIIKNKCKNSSLESTYKILHDDKHGYIKIFGKEVYFGLLEKLFLHTKVQLEFDDFADVRWISNNFKCHFQKWSYGDIYRGTPLFQESYKRYPMPINIVIRAYNEGMESIHTAKVFQYMVYRIMLKNDSVGSNYDLFK